MFIHELYNPLTSVYVTNEKSNKVVMIEPSAGAVFDYPDVCDIINIALATGDLFTNDWRVSTTAEQVAFQNSKDDRRVKPVRVAPLIKGTPSLTVITGDKS